MSSLAFNRKPAQIAKQSPWWIFCDPCLQFLCQYGDKINSVQREALCMSLQCHHTWPGLDVETSPTSKFSADRPAFPFCTL